jgi:hypothetical protein
MSNDVTPNLKENVGPCGCGCPAYGTLKRPWRSNGVRCVARKCECRQCKGKNAKKGGGRKQSKALTAIGVPRSSMHPGHEEHVGGNVRVEVKSGAQVRPILTRYLAMEAQSEAARPIGDNRPFVGVAMPEGVSWGLVLIRTDRLEDVVAALAVHFGMFGEAS